VRAEIPGRREERGRRRHRERGRDAGGGAGAPANGAAPRAERSPQPQEAPPPREGAAREERPPAEGGARDRTLVDGVVELLRASEGRTLHVRAIADQVAKRRLLDARLPPPEVVREVRAALVRELRDRVAEGLRPRVRSLGGGQYAYALKKLESELYGAERELAERLTRLREQVRVALRRRIGRLPPGAFELLTRALCDKMGLPSLELVRRGDGVAYFGGARSIGAGAVRTLVAVRPGEAELNRRAVGELRAGLQARGYEEGVLFAGGRLSGEAQAELKAGAGVRVYDGAQVALLCARHGVGVRRALAPVDYLDLDFFAEITEG
jgi:hypothetical protein